MGKITDSVLAKQAEAREEARIELVLARLVDDRVPADMFDRLSVSIQPWTFQHRLSFVPRTGDISRADQEFLRHAFGIDKMDRTFSERSGSFFLEGRRESPVPQVLPDGDPNRNATPPELVVVLQQTQVLNCKVTPKTTMEEVTRYVAECGPEESDSVPDEGRLQTAPTEVRP